MAGKPYREEIKNVADREKVNTVRKEYFGVSRPASALGARRPWTSLSRPLAGRT